MDFAWSSYPVYGWDGWGRVPLAGYSHTTAGQSQLAGVREVMPCHSGQFFIPIPGSVSEL